MATTTNLQIVVSAKDNASATLRSIGGQLGSLGSSPAFSLLGGAAKVATAAIAGLGAATIATGIAGIKSAASFEQTKIALTTMMGSADKAGDMLAKVAKFAAETPFEMPELATATKQLMAFGFQADEAFNGMKILGDISAGLNVPIGDLAYLFGTLKAQGRAFTIDIRQFAMRGLPIYEELGKVMGASGEKLNDMISDGKVGFPQVQKALENMTKEGGRFYGSMANQATSLSGLYSTLSDNMGFMLREIIGINLRGEVRSGSIFDLTRQAAQKLIVFVDANKEKIANAIQGMITKAIKAGKDWIEQMGGPEGIKDRLIEIGKETIQFAKNVKDLIPKVLEITNKMADLVKKISDFVSQNPELSKVLTVLVAIAGSAALFNPLTGIIVGIIIIFKQLIEIVKALRDIWSFGMQKNRAELETLWINAQLAGIKIKDAFSGIGDKIKNGFGNAYEWIRDRFDGLKSFFRDLADGIVSPFRGIGDRIEKSFGNIGGSIRNEIQGAIDFINRAIAGYNRLASRTKLPSIPEIRYQFGGAVEAGRPIIVGEHRPEVFVPSQSGNIRQVGQGGGGNTVNINFGGLSVYNEADENRLVDKISRALNAQSNLGFYGIR